MASTSETGHLKNTTNFERLLAFLQDYGARYAPANPSISLSVLKDDYSKATQKLTHVYDLKLPYSTVVGTRRDLFKQVQPLATRLVAALEASGAPESAIEQARGLNRKLRGQRAEAISETKNAGGHKSISVSQQSFDRQADYFYQFIGLLGATTSYLPNETELQPATLSAFHSQLITANSSVAMAYAPYSNAMIARDKALYDPDGLLEKAKLVKAYVKSAFGAKSLEFEQVSGLTFKKN